jgi:hypothetical protein
MACVCGHFDNRPTQLGSYSLYETLTALAYVYVLRGKRIKSVPVWMCRSGELISLAFL